MTPNSFHIPVINLLRGVAALMVCLFHFVCTTKGFVTDEIMLSVFSFGKYGVQMFFVISGIVIPLSMIKAEYKPSNWFGFLKKRVIRIEPPYLVSLLLVLGVLVLKSYLPFLGAVEDFPSGQTLFLHVGYLIPFFDNVDWINTVYWTLAIEFQYYIIMCLAYPLMVSFKLYSRVAFYLFILTPVFFAVGPDFFIHWGALFLMGIAYVLFRTNKISLLEFAFLELIASFFVCYYLGITDLVIGILTLIVVHFFSSYQSKIGNFFGNISYSLYLTHTIIGASIVNFLSHRVDSNWGKTMVIVAGVFASVLFAYLMYIWVERRFKNIASSIKYKNSKI